MAEGYDPFAFKDSKTDNEIDNDEDESTPLLKPDEDPKTTQPFDPYAASTPYHRGEQIQMQTMQHEQSGLPDASYVETPRQEPDVDFDALERRFRALTENRLTGIINTTGVMDASTNLLSEEDKKIQIERVKEFIKKKYPNADFLKLGPIGFS